MIKNKKSFSLFLFGFFLISYFFLLNHKTLHFNEEDHKNFCSVCLLDSNIFYDFSHNFSVSLIIDKIVSFKYKTWFL